MRILKIKMILAFVLVSSFQTSCEDLLFKPNPPDTPENNFEIFWNDYDRYYSFFLIKKLNWDSIYNTKRPQISSATTPKQLFDVFNEIIQYLGDGHADLRSPTFGYSRFDSREATRLIN